MPVPGAPLTSTGELDCTGTLLGVVENPRIADAELDLNPGDTLLLYTDGVLDTVGEAGRFGEERLLECIRAAPADPPALLDHLDAALDAFQRGPQRDDTAMVAVRYDGNGSRGA